MSSQQELYKFLIGYKVGPTPTDILNAISYATNKLKKEICTTPEKKDKWKWTPEKALGYICPKGLDCENGTCRFTEGGCKDYSEYPYYDCKRHHVSCDINSSGVCEVCDFGITDIGYIGPFLNETAPDYCNPGDPKYVTENNKKVNPKCPGNPQSKPYELDGKTVSCKSDIDCMLQAVGKCQIEKDQKEGQCVFPNKPYLEWWSQDQSFKGTDTTIKGGRCLMALPEFKRWCEMPWTRNDSDNPDTSKPLGDQIRAEWKTKGRYPFYYDQNGAKCYTTKSYCSNNLTVGIGGGFDAGYGEGEEYIKLFSDCKQPKGTQNEIQSGYDCCMDLGDSIGQFFLGRTILEGLKDPTSWATYVANTRLGTFFSDPNLKQDISLLRTNYVDPTKDIHLYLFTWNSQANSLYGLNGMSIGFMADEISRYYPSQVYKNEYGHSYILPDETLSNDKTFKRIIYILKNRDLLAKLLSDTFYEQNKKVYEIIQGLERHTS